MQVVAQDAVEAKEELLQIKQELLATTKSFEGSFQFLFLFYLRILNFEF